MLLYSSFELLPFQPLHPSALVQVQQPTSIDSVSQKPVNPSMGSSVPHHHLLSQYINGHHPWRLTERNNHLRHGFWFTQLPIRIPIWIFWVFGLLRSSRITQWLYVELDRRVRVGYTRSYRSKEFPRAISTCKAVRDGGRTVDPILHSLGYTSWRVT